MSEDRKKLWTSEELTASARASAAGDDLPSAAVPTPPPPADLSERASAWVASRADGAWLEEQVERLVPALAALLAEVAAEAEARGRKEEREACARECEAMGDEAFRNGHRESAATGSLVAMMEGTSVDAEDGWAALAESEAQARAETHAAYDEHADAWQFVTDDDEAERLRESHGHGTRYLSDCGRCNPRRDEPGCPSCGDDIPWWPKLEAARAELERTRAVAEAARVLISRAYPMVLDAEYHVGWRDVEDLRAALAALDAGA